ncbi:MAG TPA: galactosyldiacylglycerol synthase [Candidatus Didemnitutus sp.]|nr:galactosyldiacylglycerol synthase [Candidatus Didemnitutus sp.]
MSRVLILTAGYGEGHNSAARALHAAFNERPGVTAELVDLFALRAPRFNNVSRRAYVRTINHAPRIWSSIYQWLDRSPHAPWVFGAMAGHTRLLADIIAEKQPTALVSTYPVYAWLIQRLRAQGRVHCPLYTVVTDALTINSLWYRAPSDAWFVSDRDSAASLVNAGVPADQVHIAGFPVSLAFADRPTQWQPPDTTERGQPRRVLYMINSGRARALETAKALLVWDGWQITFTAGRDAWLKSELERLARGAPAQADVIGWTDRIPELLMTHHVVISKAGGATTQESINALCPMLVNQVVPGQEEGNYELLRRHEAGALAETPAAIVETLQRAFANDAAVWQQWRRNLRNLARPSAARDIAAIVLAPIPVETPLSSTR